MIIRANGSTSRSRCEVKELDRPVGDSSDSDLSVIHAVSSTSGVWAFLSQRDVLFQPTVCHVRHLLANLFYRRSRLSPLGKTEHLPSDFWPPRRPRSMLSRLLSARSVNKLHSSPQKPDQPAMARRHLMGATEGLSAILPRDRMDHHQHHSTQNPGKLDGPRLLSLRETFVDAASLIWTVTG